MGIKKLWIARDSWGDLYLYKDKPYKDTTSYNSIVYSSYEPYCGIPSEWLPEITPEGGPVEIEIKIKDNGD